MKWEKVSLESISTRIGDGLHGTPKYDDNGEFYFINGNNLSEGKILIKEDTKRISSIEYDKIKKELSQKTVLVAINGTLGNVGLYRDEPVALGKSACYINVNDKAEKLFVRYVLENQDFQRYAIDFATGSTIKNLGLKAVRDYSFNLPPLPTQRKIASILSAYDDLIENNLKRIKLMEEKLMIEYSLLEEDSKNLKEFDFSNFVTFVKGIEPGSSNYLSEKSDGTLPFIRVGDLSKRDSDIFVEESKTKGIISNPNDVLISMDGTIGIVRYGIYGCYSSGIRKAVSNGVLNNAFIFCYLSSKKIQGVIYSHSKGSTIQHAGSSISHFKVKLPKETSLNNFIKFSNPIFDMMNNLLKQNTKLREARDILLPKLMSGQIEV